MEFQSIFQIMRIAIRRETVEDSQEGSRTKTKNK